jgi:hypothetical protein
MKLEQPLVRQAKDYEPQDQHKVVQNGAPQEKIAEGKVIHGVSFRVS